MTPLRAVPLNEIGSLAIGAWILGTGGGGSPYLALLNLRKLYAAGTVVSLMDPADLADDDWVAVVSNMGAPLVGQERLTDPATIARAVTMMEEITGRHFRAIMSLEIGGGNALQPFMAAALLGRPVVDGDCMGRAFPESTDDELRHPRPLHVPADARRRARQRGHRPARRELDVDGAPLARCHPSFPCRAGACPPPPSATPNTLDPENSSPRRTWAQKLVCWNAPLMPRRHHGDRAGSRMCRRHGFWLGMSR